MKRVLVVDCDPSILDMMRAVLEVEPYEVLTAREPSSAAEVLTTGPVDIVVTDLFGGLTPHSSHPSLAPLIESAGKTPVLGMTSHDVPRGFVPSSLGVADVIGKPFDLSDLLGRIGRLVPALT